MDAPDFLKKFIEEIKKNPVIYDRKYGRESESMGLKEMAWKKIAENLDIEDVDLCKIIWKGLRDRFVQDHKKGKTGRFNQELQFVIPHIRFYKDPVLEESQSPTGAESTEMRDKCEALVDLYEMLHAALSDKNAHEIREFRSKVSKLMKE